MYWKRILILKKSQICPIWDLTLPKLAFDCQKIAKNLTYLKKNCQKLSFFGNFFEKYVKFLAIFWHSNGNFPEGQFWTK